MYEENENKIDWMSILKKLGMIVGAIIVVLLIVVGVSKCTKKDTPKLKGATPVDLTEQLNELENATLKYLTKDNLPVEINASKTIRLKILTNKNIITEIKDSDGNRCDANESYSEVTRLENNYAVKISLVCGPNKDYRIVYVGCFENCNGGICKGEENSTNGICNVSTTNPDPTKPTQNPGNTPSTSTTTTKKPTTTTKKPTTTTTTKKPTTTTTTQKRTMYEYQKCTTTPSSCQVGSPNNGRCEKAVPFTEYGTVTMVGGGTTTKNVPSTPVYYKTVSAGKNALVKYSYYYAGYVPKENSTNPHKFYKCNEGTISSDGKSCKVTVSTPGTPSCVDKSYTYYNGKCSRMSYRIEYYEMTPGKTYCETQWSYSTSISGWTRTGRTK